MEGLEAAGMMGEGGKFSRFSGSGIGAGQAVTLRFGKRRLTGWFLLAGGIAVFTFLMLAARSAGRKQYIRRQAEKKALLDAVIKLDRAYQSRELDREAYEAQREILKKALSQLLHKEF
jgi:hypothetical protein